MAPLRRREIELSVERDLLDSTGSMRRVRLSARFDVEGGGGPPTPDQLADSMRSLEREIEEAGRLAGFRSGPARRERDLAELVETYRPRQTGLVDALEADGELTAREAGLLRSAIPSGGAEPRGPLARARAPPPAEIPPITDRPLAAMPLANDRTPSVARSIADLLSTYRIETIKQAGAVRARRQISFDEYMLLKRHFATNEPTESEAPGPEGRRT